MNITLGGNINQLTLEKNAKNYKERNLAERVTADCSNNTSGVILELSKVTTQDGFVRVKEEAGGTTSDTVQVASTRALTTSQIQDFQTRLRALGFYTGSQDGNPITDAFKKAVSNFQKTYGLTVTGNIEDTATQDKMRSAYSNYIVYKSSAGMSEIKSAFSLDDTRANNFALTWTYLKIGMGLTDAQAAGVMGNVYQESGFSSTNAQNSYGYPGWYNPEYTYKTNDGVGYGLMQWTYWTRKEDLAEIASDMEMGVGNINTQLALMQYESKNTYKSAWDSLKSSTTVNSATEIVMNRIEQAGDTVSIANRKNYAMTIYNAMT